MHTARCRLAVVAFLLTAAACSDSAPSTSGLPDPGPGATALTVVTTPGGAAVTIDGVGVGNSPVTVSVKPGPHRLRASMSGYYPAPETKIVVERGAASSHTLSLVPSH